MGKSYSITSDLLKENMTGLKTNTVLLLPHDNEWDRIVL